MAMKFEEFTATSAYGWENWERLAQMGNPPCPTSAALWVAVDEGGWLEFSAADGDLRATLLDAVSVDGAIVDAPTRPSWGLETAQRPTSQHSRNTSAWRKGCPGAAG